MRKDELIGPGAHEIPLTDDALEIPDYLRDQINLNRELRAEIERLEADRDRQKKSREHYIEQTNRLEAENARYRKAVEYMEGVMSDSNGVDGFHLNGDIATWDEIIEDSPWQALLNDGKCKHEWTDARNSVVTSGEICLKCNSIRAGNESQENCAHKRQRWRPDFEKGTCKDCGAELRKENSE